MDDLEWTQIVTSSVSNEDSHAMMLIILPDNIQNLVVFKHPAKNTLVRDIIKQVGIEEPINDKIFCMVNNNKDFSNIQYITTLGIDKDLYTLRLVMYNALKQPNLKDLIKQNLEELNCNRLKIMDVKKTVLGSDDLLCHEELPPKKKLNLNATVPMEPISKFTAIKKWLNDQPQFIVEDTEEILDPYVSVESKSSSIAIFEKFVDCYFKIVNTYKGRLYETGSLGAHRCILSQESVKLKELIYAHLHNPVTVTNTGVAPRIFKKRLW